MQDNIQINGDKITGTLHKIESWLGFSNILSEQSGHYLVLKITPLEKATIKTKIGDSGKEVTVNDGFCVYLVKNEKTQKIYVKTEKAETVATKVYDLSGLVLEEG